MTDSLYPEYAGDLPIAEPYCGEGEGQRRYFGQHQQDRWVIETVFDGKVAGYFLEMGAANGILLSNTFVLEQDFQWNGILVEPTHEYESLVENRSVECINICVGAEPGYTYIHELPGPGYFNERPENTLRATTIAASSLEEATALAAKQLPRNIVKRLGSTDYNIRRVEVVTLEQLLDQYQAPPVIDFFSLDVEGDEADVLAGFDFTKYVFRSLIVERPVYSLRKILLSNGYISVAVNRIGDVYYIHESFMADYETNLTKAKSRS